jgi:hypothetical protein
LRSARKYQITPEFGGHCGPSYVMLQSRMILLAFAPFIVFVIVDRFAGSLAGLAAGAITSAILLIYDFVTPKRSVKILEFGTFILFGGLTAYTYLSHKDWSVFGVRLFVDGGLLVIVLLSMALRRPFTIQYARERVPKEAWTSPEFLRTNYIITAAWAVAFAAMALIDILMISMPGAPARLGIFVTIAAIWGAYHFTQWYPARTRSKVVR